MSNQEPAKDRAMSLAEIGRALDPPVTRERVRQIETRALRKLRIECERVGITLQDVLETWDHQTPAIRGPR
jgi:DNA-directed RNA polymerase sigma subunit (sigma70/sigma32)